jgi:hypothetical protein
MADESVKPPTTNRGVAFSFRLDWLTFTVWSDVHEVAIFALRLLGLEGDLSHFELLPHGTMGFSSVYRHSSGMRLSGDAVSVKGQVYCTVSMSGEVASCCSAESLVEGFGDLGRQGIRYNISRLDLAFDTDQVKPLDIYDAVGGKRFRSHVEQESLMRLHMPFAGEPSDTVTFGSRTSERFLRVYLGHGATRVELECKGARALQVFEDLLSRDVGLWPRRALAHILDFADFECVPWHAFCDGVVRANLTVGYVQSSIEQTRNWIWTQVAASLALVAEVDGADALDALVLYGFTKFGAKQRAMLAGRSGYGTG